MIEVSDDEVEAVREWNCGMLLKRKQRALLCRSFYSWKTSFLSIIGSKCSKIQSEIDQKNSIVKKLSFTSHLDANQSISQLQTSNQQLQKELEELQKKQQELEKATNKIRDTLNSLKSPAPGSSRMGSTSNSGASLGSSRLSASSTRKTSSRYQFHY